MLDLVDTGRPYVYLPCYPNSSWGNEPYYSICLKPPDRKEETSTSVPVVINPYLRLPINEIAKVNSYIILLTPSIESRYSSSQSIHRVK